MALYTPSALSALYAPAVSGRLYRPATWQGVVSTPTTLGRLAGRSIRLQAGTLDRLYVNHDASATASELVRIGIYYDNNGRPGALLLDAGTIDLSTATAVKSITISQPITTGRWWIMSVRQGPTNTATVKRYTASSSTNKSHEAGVGWSEMENAGDTADREFTSFGVSSVTGALPNPFGTATNEFDTMVVVTRYA
jgi:hypothetical protein